MKSIARPGALFSLTCLLAAVAHSQGGSTCPASPLTVASPLNGSLGFSRSLDIDGDVLVAGGVVSPSSSAVAVYERDQGGPGAWGQVATLLPTGGGAASSFGVSAGASGDLIALGSSSENQAYLYERDQGGPGAWGLFKIVAGPPGDPVGNQGGTVALEGDTLAVAFSGPLTDAVYVFERDEGGPDNWGRVAVLLPASPTFGNFGNSLSISADTLVVGDDQDSGLGPLSGSATLFERTAGAWSLVKYLEAPNGLGGQTFGRSVSVDGDTLLVGADNTDTALQSAGTAWIFQRDLGGPGNWGQLKRIDGSTPQAFGRFGLAVSLEGQLAVVGAPTWGSSNGGRAYLFSRDAGGVDEWGEIAPLFAPNSNGSNFGRTIAMDGRVAVVGSPNTPAPSGTGVVYVYDQVTDDCAVPYCTAGTSANGCRATLSATGTASASLASGFVLLAAGAEGGVFGLFFFGTNGQQANPWGNGTSLQCVAPPVDRAGLLTATGTSGTCDGAFAQDLNAYWCPGCPKPAKNPGAGALVQVQLWYRDALSTSNQTTSLSNALEFTVGI